MDCMGRILRSAERAPRQDPGRRPTQILTTLAYRTGLGPTQTAKNIATSARARFTLMPPQPEVFVWIAQDRPLPEPTPSRRQDRRIWPMLSASCNSGASGDTSCQQLDKGSETLSDGVADRRTLTRHIGAKGSKHAPVPWIVAVTTGKITGHNGF